MRGASNLIRSCFFPSSAVLYDHAMNAYQKGPSSIFAAVFASMVTLNFSFVDKHLRTEKNRNAQRRMLQPLFFFFSFSLFLYMRCLGISRIGGGYLQRDKGRERGIM
ncbi:hypothetical protein F4782DRAFT_219643 [Xylaria castorea]|nr:hypothetical protein F4782DRAFT_219643 [Xylaria castorea]